MRWGRLSLVKPEVDWSVGRYEGRYEAPEAAKLVADLNDSAVCVTLETAWYCARSLRCLAMVLVT